MPPKIRTKISAAVAGDAKPFQTRSGRLWLKGPQGAVSLSDSRGVLTAAGRIYYEGKEKPRIGFDEQTALHRDGGKEYVINRDGSKKLARRWNPAESDYSYTRIGRQYFEARGEVSEYVVMVPVIISGSNRKTGAPYQRFGHLPHSSFSNTGTIKLPFALPEKEKHRRLKESIMTSWGDSNRLLEVSDEKYEYHQDGNWRISSLTTVAGQGGDIAVNAVLDRPLASASAPSFSHLPNSAGFDPSVFEESKKNGCVPHQLAATLDMDESYVRDQMDEIQNLLYPPDTPEDPFEGKHWSSKGCTARMLARFCEIHARNCVICWGTHLIQNLCFEKRKHDKSCVACVWGDHLYTWADASAKHSLAKSAAKAPSAGKEEVLARPHVPSSKIELSEYEPWSGALQPGKFYTTLDAMQGVLETMLAQNRVPAIKMRSYLEARHLELKDTTKDTKTVVTALPFQLDGSGSIRG